MVKKIAIITAAVLTMVACNKLDMAGFVMPTSGSVEQRVQQSLDINQQVGQRTVVVAQNNYRFYACTDIHTGDYPQNYAHYLRTVAADTAAAFALMLGDISNQQGAIFTAHAVADSLLPSTVPQFAIVGNHDLFFNQWQDYVQCYGSSTYSVEVRTPDHTDLILMLDSGGGCHGKTQTQWLRQQLSARNRYRHVIVCTHVNIFRTDLSQFMSGNLPVEETYDFMHLCTEKNVSLVLQGHDHHAKETLFNGVRYLTVDCLKDGTDNAGYLVADVNEAINTRIVAVEQK